MNPELEFLHSFDVADVQVTVASATEETDELAFRFIRRNRPLLGEADYDDEQMEGEVVDPPDAEEHLEEEELVNPPEAVAQARKGKMVAREELQLPSPPEFEDIFRHQKEKHSAQSNLPQAVRLDSQMSPLSVFSLFFTEATFSELARNTNSYANSKEAGDVEGSRHWEVTTPDELRIFFGIITYMGVFKSPSVKDYWSTNPEYPQHTITDFMSLTRFQQLKRFFHISPPDTPDEPWFSKVQPLSDNLASLYTRYYVPSTNVSIDKMIVRFSGRSGHTVRMKGKPTPEGYKILALCDAGYTYSFLYTSRIKSIVGIKKIKQLTLTSSAVVHLANSLPPSRTFNIYMDNYFSNVPLFTYLRGLKIGACGTVRINSTDYPKLLKVSKAEKMQWNKLSGMVVNNQVLAVVWMDNAPVTMLTTIHTITNQDDFVKRTRRRPRETSTNAARTREVFKGHPTAELLIPKLIDDYNHYMNGVDISDQYRSYYSTQLTVLRTWMPLFFWIFDTTIINCYRIYTVRGGTFTHKEFRIKLAWDLVRTAAQSIYNSDQRKRSREYQQTTRKKSIKKKSVTKKRPELPPIRLIPGDHFPLPVTDGSRLCCFFCRFMYTIKGDENYDPKTQTTWTCETCQVPLCINKTRHCFRDFHKMP